MKPTGGMTNVAPGKGGIERDPQTLANHRFFAGSHEAMLRACLSVSADPRAAAAPTVGRAGRGRRPSRPDRLHRPPPAPGRPGHRRRRPRAGPDLGPASAGPAGAALAGRPGRLFGRILRGLDGQSPAPFWRADPTPVDTRLAPGRAERFVFDFPPGLARLEVRLLYRRFWDEVAQAKGWPDRDLVVLARTFLR